MSRDALPRPGSVRDELAQLGQHPRKRFGQHFLSDTAIAARIVQLAQIDAGDAVIEIGPGLGALTDPLVQSAGRVWLIEIDSGLAERLRQRYAGQAHVEVIEADALSVDFAALLPPATQAVVIGNLPYNIATPLIAELLKRHESFRRLVFMVQREVAERLRAQPGSKDYSSLSVLTQLAARVDKGFVVGPAAFVPRPKVDSEVIRIEPHTQPPVSVADPAAFTRLVQTVFRQRRKQLANSLKPLSPTPESILRRAGIDPKRRPETLSLAEFAHLSEVLQQAAGDPAITTPVA